MTAPLATDEEIAELVASVEKGGNGDRAVEALLARYPKDPRLHFMQGSLLAEGGRAIEAHRAMSRALELEPAYALARYQLGLFELSSGEPARALSTWGPLLALGSDQYLRNFVEGMAHLIRDEFGEAIALFERGIALNRENEPMNRDIRLLIDRCRQLDGAGREKNTDREHSATSLILGQFGGSRTIQ
jgi:tetratricopeptide (TPR) repeat protein